MDTVSPLPAEVGVNAETTGVGARNVKPGFMATPFGLDTETMPELPEPITAVMFVALTTVNEAAAFPPK